MQRIGGVVAEGGTSTTDAKQPMDRRRPDLAHRISEVRIACLEERRGVGDALAHPSGCLPSGRGKGDSRCGTLITEQGREDRGHSAGLARTGTTNEHAEPRCEAGSHGLALAVVEVHPLRQVIDGLRCRRRLRGERDQPISYGNLEVVEASEIDETVLDAQDIGGERRVLNLAQPRCRLDRPRKRGDGRSCVVVNPFGLAHSGLAGMLRVEGDMTRARGGHGEGKREHDMRSRLPDPRGEAGRDVDLGGIEDACLAPGLKLLEEFSPRAHRPPSRSRRSTERTAAGAGVHHTVPLPGVSGRIPRTNR